MKVELWSEPENVGLAIFPLQIVSAVPRGCLISQNHGMACVGSFALDHHLKDHLLQPPALGRIVTH